MFRVYCKGRYDTPPSVALSSGPSNLETNILKIGGAVMKTVGPELSQNRSIVPLKKIEYGVYGDLIIIYPKPYSIYFRRTVGV